MVVTAWCFFGFMCHVINSTTGHRGSELVLLDPVLPALFALQDAPHIKSPTVGIRSNGCDGGVPPWIRMHVVKLKIYLDTFRSSFTSAIMLKLSLIVRPPLFWIGKFHHRECGSRTFIVALQEARCDSVMTEIPTPEEADHTLLRKG